MAGKGRAERKKAGGKREGREESNPTAENLAPALVLCTFCHQ